MFPVNNGSYLTVMKNAPPSVSVVIPTFNRAACLLNAIESALIQTYRNKEIIVVDDGSTDNTKEKLKPYLGQIRYHYQENRGASAAQNRGIELAEGEWIAILASDDTWLPNKLESQIKGIDIMGREFGVCFTNSFFVGDPRGIITAFQEAVFQPRTEFGVLEEPVRWILAPHPILFFQSILVKRALMVENNGFDEKMIVAEDTDLLFRLSRKTKFCFVNHALVNVNREPGRADRLSVINWTADARSFVSHEIMYQKWVCLLEGAADVVLQKIIADLLMKLYYRWAIVSVKSLKWSNFFQSVGKLKLSEKSYANIYLNIICMVWLGGIQKIASMARIFLEKQVGPHGHA